MSRSVRVSRTRVATALLVAVSLSACFSDPSPADADAALDAAGDGSGGDAVTDADDDTGGDADDDAAPGDADDDIDAPQGDAAVGDPCSDDRECASNVCFQIGTGGVGGFCSTFCGTDDDCPEGEWDCAFLVNSGGDAARICVSPTLCLDADGDGFGFGAGCEGPDCDEGDDAVNPGAAEVCDDKDNDCDGRIDDFPVDVGEDCNTGFPGPCSEGRIACINGSAVCESTRAPEDEVCDGVDNDCDREVDEGPDGLPLSEVCYGGPEETRAVGACVEGTRTCTDGRLGACVGQVLPFAELCDGIDNDCDGTIDNGDPSTGVPCNTGLPGACARGTTLCSSDAAECSQTIFPSAELCDGIDNDCDGLTDEGADDEPLRRACYEGDPATLDVGPCRGGSQLCTAGDFGPCIGDVIPAAEICDGIDNNCDGDIDNDAVGGGACATGLPGVCAVGFLSCEGGATAACTPLTAASAEICDGLDNDCDGSIDENEDDEPLTRACFGGRPEQLGVGICASGVATCAGGTFSACVDQILPGAEICNGLDDDCDGEVDEGGAGAGLNCETGLPGVCGPGTTICVDGTVECAPRASASEERCDGLDNDCDGAIDESGEPGSEPLSRVCFDADPALLGVGVCREGAQVCSGGEFGSCIGDVVPTAELCNALDDDCDGEVDEGAVGGGSCNTGLPGICALGFTACGSDATGECIPVFEPSAEICDGIDNDCDGDTDENEDGSPLRIACYSGLEDEVGVGICRSGLSTCVAGAFAGCVGQVLPGFERCDGVDNDCDGLQDEGSPEAGFPCSSGGLGICAPGLTVCNDGAIECIAEDAPSEERCDGVDNDCDGDTDEDALGDPLARTCYEGDPATIGVGVCRAGEQTCNRGEFGPCIGDVTPTVELCNALDDDCDGPVDEDAVGGGTCNTGLRGVCALGVTECGPDGAGGCVPIIAPSAEVCDGLDNDCDGFVDEDDGDPSEPLSRGCYTGAAGTLGVGPCRAGRETCVAGQFTSCQDQVTPRFEVCNGVDDDCDASIDDGNPGGGAACDTDGIGVCRPGRTACLDGELECVGLQVAAPERCDGLDNDCDGATDEGADGNPLARTCYDGDPALIGVGACRSGNQVCSDGEFGVCTGDVLPSVELCNNRDDDCDGLVDNNTVSAGTCSTGLSGVCSTGAPVCQAGGVTVCEPIVRPSLEVCDGIDNDCDGLVDEDAAGDPIAIPCFGGTPEQEGVGVCRGGFQYCVGGTLSTCQGQVLPSVEVCDGVDNNCDGLEDDGNPGGGLRCDTGEFGLCAPGLTACLLGEVECIALFDPEAEFCDGYDNDCDGLSDEDDLGQPLTRACYDGAEGTLGVGPCIGGTQACTRGQFGTCVGQRVPVDEVCDFVDNDCDDEIDEGVRRPFYVDSDGDGYGDPDTVVLACLVDGYVTNGLDCYDLNAQANPEQTGAFTVDRGDGSFDYDCDGFETSALGGYGACQSDPPLCYLQVQGWVTGVPIPDCGQQGTYIFDCLGNGANCDPTTALTTQRCR